MLSAEHHLPYSRPPLTKDLWNSEDPNVAANLKFKNWEGAESEYVNLNIVYVGFFFIFKHFIEFGMKELITKMIPVLCLLPWKQLYAIITYFLVVFLTLISFYIGFGSLQTQSIVRGWDCCWIWKMFDCHWWWSSCSACWQGIRPCLYFQKCTNTNIFLIFVLLF